MTNHILEPREIQVQPDDTIEITFLPGAQSAGNPALLIKTASPSDEGGNIVDAYTAKVTHTTENSIKHARITVPGNIPSGMYNLHINSANGLQATFIRIARIKVG